MGCTIRHHVGHEGVQKWPWAWRATVSLRMWRADPGQMAAVEAWGGVEDAPMRGNPGGLEQGTEGFLEEVEVWRVSRSELRITVRRAL